MTPEGIRAYLQPDIFDWGEQDDGYQAGDHLIEEVQAAIGEQLPDDASLQGYENRIIKDARKRMATNIVDVVVSACGIKTDYDVQNSQRRLARWPWIPPPNVGRRWPRAGGVDGEKKTPQTRAELIHWLLTYFRQEVPRP